MTVGRIIGWILIFAGVAALIFQIGDMIETGVWTSVSLGQVWFDFHTASLNAAQAGIQRYLWPALWDPGIQTVLSWPAWIIVGVPGIALLWFCRRHSARRKRRFLFKRRY